VLLERSGQKTSLVLKLSQRHDAAVQAFISFLGVAAIAAVIPGPDTFVVLRTALADGPRAGTWAAGGSAVGNLVWGSASALGVAAVLAASATAFSAIKVAGAAYLVVVGLQALRAAVRGESLASDGGVRREVSRSAAFRRGVASDMLNVKVGLFWTALVPQFVAAESSALLPAAMVGAMATMVFAWLSVYAHLAGRLSAVLKRRRSSQAVNGTVGTVLVALGGRLALAPH
jgi:threonine/homoserine/homoserine lactone efflux protein